MKHRFFAAMTALAISGTTVFAQGQQPMGGMQPNMMKMGGPLIDVPIVLKDAKVVFRVDRVAPSGDNSFTLQQMSVLSDKFRQMGTDAKVVAVFNGDGGFMLLNDMAYNEVRKSKEGNPYKAMIATILAKGVEVEECGMTMMREGWTNKQLLPGVKVNTGANLRIIDLAQKSYVVLNQ
ncbi:MAG: DsrE family protein [Rhodoferax sp.]|uniref:DsrE family protein n=1 Tax=Rhodoferax sp. TaxID=50421 RepID=UPI001400D29A|nr:DsrE family protein [Rhodoferax sp.]NDP39307.1 DsrE family protein [Rhodoferax sp.]